MPFIGTTPLAVPFIVSVIINTLFTKEISNGWKYRIEPARDSTMTIRHIHIMHGKDEYSQNDDGTPHDKKRGKKGPIPQWVNDYLKEKEDWDYNGNRHSFYNQTTAGCLDDGTIVYSFADGTTKTKQPLRALGLTIPQRDASTDELEEIYYSSNTNGSWASGGSTEVPIPLVPTTPITVPEIGPFAIPVSG